MGSERQHCHVPASNGPPRCAAFPLMGLTWAMPTPRSPNGWARRHRGKTQPVSKARVHPEYGTGNAKSQSLQTKGVSAGVGVGVGVRKPRAYVSG